jgi:hypothetical protein
MERVVIVGLVLRSGIAAFAVLFVGYKVRQ